MLQQQLERCYTTAELYEFNLVHCDKIVRDVLERIGAGNPP